MLNIPHSKPGNLTIGLQCGVPAGVSATPLEVAGYDLTLGINAAGAVANFTYTVNPDALYPNGWLQPAQNFATSNTMFSVFIAVSITAASCTFTDAANTAIANGYPTLYFPCAEVVVPSSTNLSTNAALLAAPLGVLLWTQTPGSSTLPALGSAFALDGGNVAQPCSAGWPCSLAAPFGGATATVLEASTAPRVMLLPQGCAGASCTAVNGSIPAPFSNCPGGKVTMMGVTTGNATTASTAAPTSSSPPSMSNSDIVAWLAVLTAVYSFFFIGQCLLALHTRISRTTAAADKLAPEAAPPLPAEAAAV